MNDSQTDDAQGWLQAVLELMGLPLDVQTIPAPAKDDAQQWLELVETGGESLPKELLLDQDGDALDALQFLLNTTMNLQTGRKQAFTVEFAGHRAQRQQQLTALAWEAAEKVRATGEEFVFGSLSAAERRQIHMVLQEEPDLDTFSRGKEPERRLVVRPKTGDGEMTEPPDEVES